MKLAVALISFACFNAKRVQFQLPTSSTSTSKSRSLISAASVTSCSSSSSSESTSSSEVKLFKDKSDSDGRFRNLRKDDDLLNLKKKKKKRSKNRSGNKRQSGKEESGKTGGKQTVGFSFNGEWRKEMEKLVKTKNKFNGFSEDFVKLTEGIVTEPVNAGWWLFSFSGGKSVSKTSFKFKTNLPVKISIVDLFCRGDSFAVLNDGKLIAQSSRIPADRECEETMISPQEALIDGRWSSVVFEIYKGEHNIELKTVDSPMETGGVAAIKFEYILPSGMRERRVSRDKVCRGYNGLFVVKVPVTSEAAETICLTLKSEIAKMQLADLAAWKSVKTCVGASGRVWALNKETGDVGTVSLDGKKAKYINDNKSKAVLCRVRS